MENYKLTDDISLDLSRCLKIQNKQEALAEAWKPMHEKPRCHMCIFNIMLKIKRYALSLMMLSMCI